MQVNPKHMMLYQDVELILHNQKSSSYRYTLYKSLIYGPVKLKKKFYTKYSAIEDVLMQNETWGKWDSPFDNSLIFRFKKNQISNSEVVLLLFFSFNLLTVSYCICFLQA